MKSKKAAVYIILLLAIAQVPNQSMARNCTALNDGDSSPYRLYVTGPPNAKAGVLFVHDYFGLSEAAKKAMDHLGKLGYLTVGIDLYKGKVGTTDEEATGLMNAKDSTETNQIIANGIGFLKQKVDRLVAIGFSAGAVDAVRATLLRPELFDAAIVVYGGGYDQLDRTKLAAMSMPILAITGSRDQWPLDAALNFLHINNRTLELHVFANADHGYAQPLFHKGANYSTEATDFTWKIIEEFLLRHLPLTTGKK